MIIDRNIKSYLILCDESIKNAIKKIDANKNGFVIGIDQNGVIEGVVTDGDIRRWMIQASNVDINLPISNVLNKTYKSCYTGDNYDKVNSLLTSHVKFIPMLDRQQRVVALARQRLDAFKLGDFYIGDDRPTFIIAEIGNNHNGSFELAKQLVDLAVESGADCAKFQMRHMASLYKNSGNANDAKEDLGSQYTLDLLSKNQLRTEDMFRVFDYCKKKGIFPLCTAWDLESLAQLEKYGMEGYKTASADLTNHELLTAAAATGKPLICSTGMTMEGEIVDSVKLLTRHGAQYVLLHCNSTYPAPFKDINLQYMKTLKRIGNCPIGYSGHERGYNVAVAAVGLGARVIEKHFTVDRNMEGIDHKVSLLPDEFRAMIAGIREVEQALGAATERKLTQGEMMNRESLGKSLVITCELEKGRVIREEMIAIRAPGQGLPPYRKADLIGKVARRQFKQGDTFFPSDIDNTEVSARSYSFRHPFGIPVRYHDLSTLAAQSNFGMLEFHLSYKDLEEDLSKYFKNTYDMDFVVHAPELFEGDHVLDLCSDDPEYLSKSLANMARVIDVTKKLKEFFPKTKTPRIVVNMGGFTQNAPMSGAEKAKCYEKLKRSLAKLNSAGVQLLAQTMPPFPWHFGGQRFHNLFVDPDEIVAFCKDNKAEVCLDISHSKLACTHFNWSFESFLGKVCPYSSHFHIADARGVDGEGLQVGDGDIDFVALGKCMNNWSPRASFIPEIWQGHKNKGEGFWIALERLEGLV